MVWGPAGVAGKRHVKVGTYAGPWNRCGFRWEDKEGTGQRPAKKTARERVWRCEEGQALKSGAWKSLLKQRVQVGAMGWWRQALDRRHHWGLWWSKALIKLKGAQGWGDRSLRDSSPDSPISQIKTKKNEIGDQQRVLKILHLLPASFHKERPFSHAAGRKDLTSGGDHSWQGKVKLYEHILSLIMYFFFPFHCGSVRIFARIRS